MTKIILHLRLRFSLEFYLCEIIRCDTGTRSKSYRGQLEYCTLCQRSAATGAVNDNLELKFGNERKI